MDFDDLPDIPHEANSQWWNQSGLGAEHTAPIPRDPSDTYLSLFVADLDAIGAEVRIKADGKRHLYDPNRKATDRIRAVLAKCGDVLVAYMMRVGRIKPESTDPPKPKPGQVVIWVGWDGGHHVAVAEELDMVDWVRWCYRGDNLWHSYSGFTWTERDMDGKRRNRLYRTGASGANIPGRRPL